MLQVQWTADDISGSREIYAVLKCITEYWKKAFIWRCFLRVTKYGSKDLDVYSSQHLWYNFLGCWKIEIPHHPGRDLVHLDKKRREARTKGQVVSIGNLLFCSVLHRLFANKDKIFTNLNSLISSRNLLSVYIHRSLFLLTVDAYCLFQL